MAVKPAEKIVQTLLATVEKNAALPLVVHDLTEFRGMEFPAREPLVKLDRHETVVFSKRSINQIFAFRGTGKTMSSISLAGAMATGGKFLNLQAVRPSKVLYVEGETPSDQMKERFNQLVGITDPDFFRVIAYDEQPNGIAPLCTAEGRQALENALGDAEVLFLDSISTLGWFATNDEAEWLEILHWLARLRSRGLCIIFLHHAGKSGMQRGHSRSEDMLDVSIKLSVLPEDGELDWLRMKLEFDKFRGVRVGVRSLIVECKGSVWSWTYLEVEKLKMIAAYLKEHAGASSRTVARALPELGSHVTVSKLMKKLDSCVPPEEDSP